jgi:predicted permease
VGTLRQDVLFSIRVLRKSPGFTITAVLTLALAIGANAVVFSVMNAFILRPLNVPQPQSLYGLERGNNYGFQSYLDYLDLRDRNRSFDGLVAYNMLEVALDTGGNPSRAWGVEASGNYFDGLGIQPYLGRFFHTSDEHGPNSAPYVVLSYAYWHTRFQDDRSVVGRTVQLDRQPFTILGVAPPEFHGTLMFFNPEFFVPMLNHGLLGGDPNDLTARGNRWIFETMGHLKAGVTPAQAIADLNSIGSWLEKTYPKDDGKMTFTLARPSLYGNYAGPPIRAFISGLMLLAGLILLAACANLGILFAARAADRSLEVALRLALGSSYSRILRRLFTEAVLISLVGGAVGLWCSIGLMRALSMWNPIPRFPIHVPVTPDVNVYGVALLLTLASGFLFGAVPVRQILRTDPYQVIKSGSTGAVGRRLTGRDLLLIVQIALCAVLVTSCLVAVRGLMRSLHDRFGFEPQNTLLADTDLAMGGYNTETVAAMQKRMIDALETIPGVESVGLADGVPLSEGTNDSTVFSDNASDLRPANAVADAALFRISPEYFRAAGTALVSGRAFTWHDDKDAPRVAVVNRVFARKLFGSEAKAIGSYYKLPDGTRMQVVGIAEDGKYGSLTEDPAPAMFLPILQSPSSSTWLVVRSNRDPLQLGAAIRSRLRQLDAGLPIKMQTWYREMDGILLGPRMATISLGVMGVIGAILAITGIFGMAAYSVSKRLKELGIRIAVGAQRKEVLQAALGRAFKLLAIGSAGGLLLGTLASRVLALIVYEATPCDPLVLAGVVLAMAVVGLLASWIPARRALSLDPWVLLRDE